MSRGKGTEPKKPAASGPMAWAGPAVPDRRLASLFTRRSTTAPAKASRVGILDTYPPTSFGVAVFTAALAAALADGTYDTSVGVVQVGPVPAPGDDPRAGAESAGEVVPDSRSAARALNKFDLAIIQYGDGLALGAESSEVLDVLEWLQVPVVLVVHTVPSHPTAHQRFVLEMLIQSADAVVTMSRTGRLRLLDDYRAAPRRLMLIPHGAPAAGNGQQVPVQGRKPTILTWGLLGPGKGIEWGIDALAAMSPQHPRPRYVVVGQMHPHISAEEGERYRDFLRQRAEEQGVADLVEFEPRFVSPQRLSELLSEADVVLIPYESDDQITSGVLTHAMAARVPVVATAFPHAVELLSDALGGILVPAKDPVSMAAALTRIIFEPGVADAMSAHNANFTALVNWPIIASHYHQLFDALMRRPSTPGR